MPQDRTDHVLNFDVQQIILSLQLNTVAIFNQWRKLNINFISSRFYIFGHDEGALCPASVITRWVVFGHVTFNVCRALHNCNLKPASGCFHVNDMCSMYAFEAKFCYAICVVLATIVQA